MLAALAPTALRGLLLAPSVFRLPLESLAAAQQLASSSVIGPISSATSSHVGAAAERSISCTTYGPIHPPHSRDRSATASTSASSSSGNSPRCQQQQGPIHRLYNTWQYPKRVFTLPPAIKAVLERKKAEQPVIPEYQPPPLTEPRPPMSPETRRVGCIAVKAGMTQEWDAYGQRIPLTVLFVDDCQVVGVRSPEKHGYWAVQLGAGYRKPKATPLSEAGFYLARGLPFKREVGEFKVSGPEALVPVGTQITAGHFVAGQGLDVTGITKGKGFAGVMKRWGFKGLPASHGVSLAHRSPGSIGMRKDPGRVWKGKKMPGHMGMDQKTLHNCLLYKVDAARNLLYVRGQVPGAAGQFVHLRDALCVSRAAKEAWGPRPFPTCLPPSLEGGEAAEKLTSPSVYRSPKDPYRPYQEEGADYFGVKWSKGD